MHISFILERYFYLEDLKDFCAAEGLKVGGIKLALVDRLRELPLNPEFFLEHLHADDFDDLAEFIEEEHDVHLQWNNEKQAIKAISEYIEVDVHNVPDVPKTHSSKPKNKSKSFNEVYDWLTKFQHKKPENREALYEKELDIMASEKFGSKNVRTQVNVTDGRIDMEICGVGIELKLPKSDNELEITMKNLRKYKKHYGDNLILVMYFGKGARRDVVHGYLDQVESLGITYITKRVIV